MPQFYKGDPEELKYYNSLSPIAATLGAQLSAFWTGAYECYSLGEVLYDSKRAPLTNAIKREIFRESFAAIFEAFRSAGSYEAYLTVFRAIFGPDVGVVFTIINPGHLKIDIEAQGIELSDWVARRIENNAYIYDEIIDDEGDNIAFQTIKGFTSEYELKQMLFEMVPAGIYTEITLALGV